MPKTTLHLKRRVVFAVQCPQSVYSLEGFLEEVRFWRGEWGFEVGCVVVFFKLFCAWSAGVERLFFFSDFTNITSFLGGKSILSIGADVGNIQPQRVFVAVAMGRIEIFVKLWIWG